MRDCDAFRPELKAYLDGQLPAPSRLAVRFHLLRCATCRREIETMEKIGDQLRSGETRSLGFTLRQRLVDSIPDSVLDRQTTGAGKPGRLPRLKFRPKFMWGAVAAATLSWFVIYPAYQSSIPRIARSLARSSEADYAGATGATGRSFGAASIPSTAAGEPAAASEKVAQYSAPASTTTASSVAPTVQDYDELSGHSKRADTDHSFSGGMPGSGSVDGHNGDRIADASGVQQKLQVDVGSQPLYSTAPQANTKSVGHKYESIAAPAAPPASPAPPHSSSAASGVTALLDESLPTERQVHREASLTVEVRDVEQQSDDVSRLVKESKGYVETNELNTDENGVKTANLTVKVPVDSFDTIMMQFAHLGAVKAKNLSGEDITDKVVDEQETSHILKEDINTTDQRLSQRESRSQTSHDEESLRQLRIRIARSQARLKMLNKLGSLSTITVELDEKPKNPAPAPQTSGFLGDVSDDLQSAAHSFLMALRLPLQLLVWVVVYAPIWALLLVGYRKASRA